MGLLPNPYARCRIDIATPFRTDFEGGKVFPHDFALVVGRMLLEIVQKVLPRPLNLNLGHVTGLVDDYQVCLMGGEEAPRYVRHDYVVPYAEHLRDRKLYLMYGEFGI